MQPISADPDLKRDEAIAIRFARQQGLTLNELSDILLIDLCRGLPTDVVDLALRIFHATQRLQGRAISSNHTRHHMLSIRL